MKPMRSHGRSVAGALRRSAVMVAVTSFVLGAGCVNRSGAVGSGPDIDGCRAYFILETFEEPSPDDPGEVRAYADATLRVIDRIRFDYSIDREGEEDLDLPKAVAKHYETVEASMTKFRDGLEAAEGDRASVRKAMNALAADEAYLAADTALGDFYAEQCPR